MVGVLLHGSAFAESTEGKDKTSTTYTIEVVDQNHQPIPGAVVRIIGEDGWLFTDFDGMVKMQCESQATIEFNIPGEQTIVKILEFDAENSSHQQVVVNLSTN
jgi:uncharacterized protein YdeI (BOF family)